MNITIIGHVCIDHNSSENSKYTSWGSPAMFMAKIFSLIPDLNVNIISSYGPDFKQYIEQEQVKIFPNEPTASKTLVYENITKDGHRIQKAHNRTEAILPDVKDALINIIADSDVILFAPLLPNVDAEYLRTAFSHAKDSAIKVLVPQGYFRDFTEDDQVIVRDFKEGPKVMPFFDVMILSDQDYPNIMNTSITWSRVFKTDIIITNGPNGATFTTEGKQKHIETTAVSENNIVDSVGAGDIFAAAFIYEYAKSHNAEVAIRFANKVAGKKLLYTPSQLNKLQEILTE